MVQTQRSRVRKRIARRSTAELSGLWSVGPKTLTDFQLLKIRSLEQLKHADARRLYEKLSKLKRARVDPCCEDVFRCAIEQARNPNLPPEKRVWWYWTRQRKNKV